MFLDPMDVVQALAKQARSKELKEALELDDLQLGIGYQMNKHPSKFKGQVNARKEVKKVHSIGCTNVVPD
jgi:hypothetical protein